MDEDPNKCCFCIPIDIGIFLIGLGICYNAGFGTYAVVAGLSEKFIASVILGVLLLPLLIAAYYFVQYFRNRSDKDARANLPVACVYSAISALAQTVWLFLGIILYGNSLSVVMTASLSAGISFLLFSYCYGVCKRFASQ